MSSQPAVSQVRSWREFHFEPHVKIHEAMPVIVAALDDEDLVMDDSSLPGDRITSVIVDGLKAIRVPSHRISERAQVAVEQ